MHNPIPNGTFRRLLLHLLVAAGVGAGAAGCVSMPNAGPVLSYGVTPTAAGQPQANLQIVPQPPGANWGPADIVSGFLEASASFVGQQQVAREYLTPTASRGWRPGWTATVFKDGPAVLGPPRYASPRATSGTASRGTPSPKATASASSSGPDASVTVGGSVLATLQGSGAYAVASATPKARKTFTYDLVKYRGQWRISNLNGNPLLLTRPEFTADYQLRNLYFFDPTGQYLVPDPVYVPLRAPQEDLMNGLVGDLITQPRDWLAGGATRTAFPKGTTRLGNVVVDGGTASVNLGGTTSKATTTVEEQISAQLLSTLFGAGQGQQQVRSVALSVNGHPFSPSGAQGNPVQGRRDAKYSPPAGPSTGFYYVDSHGQLMRQQQTGTSSRPVKIADIGPGYSALAVSPDGDYVAALRGGQVYTGPADARSLSLRAVSGGVTSLSWDNDDNLWTTGANGVYLLTASVKPSTPPAPVYVYSPQSNCGSPSGDITALRVAPDGVRIAMVFGGQQPTLAFGAIDMEEALQPGHPRPIVTVTLSPFCVTGSQGPSSFKAVSWFGADDVIALGEPRDSLIEYPVNGGTPVPIPGSPPGIRSITASGASAGGLIASTRDALYFTPSVTGAWTPVPSGKLAAYPGLEIQGQDGHACAPSRRLHVRYSRAFGRTRDGLWVQCDLL